MNEPHINVIELYPGAGGAKGLPDLPSEGPYTATGQHQEWWRGVSYYHSDGLRYVIGSAVPDRPLGGLTGFLAATIGIPRVQVHYTYRAGVPYALPQLRDAVAAAIRADDDILTQFHEPEELLEPLGRAATFHDVAAVLRLAATDDGVYPEDGD